MIINEEDLSIIKTSIFFDKNYYLRLNTDIAESGINPLKHFCEFGWKEGRNLSSMFDTNNYISTYIDVKNSKINPLVHYLKIGKEEGRLPNHLSLMKKIAMKRAT